MKKTGTKKNKKNENLCKYDPDIASSPKGPGFLLSKFLYPKISSPVKNCKSTSAPTNKEHTEAEIKKNLSLSIFSQIKYLITKKRMKNRKKRKVFNKISSACIDFSGK